jgi:magnesium transporter
MSDEPSNMSDHDERAGSAPRTDGPVFVGAPGRVRDDGAEADEARTHAVSAAMAAARAEDADSRDVATRIEEIPAADGADVLEDLPVGDAADVAEYLDPETAGAILSEMDPTLAASVLADMEAPEASMVVAAMDPDDAVDILEHVPAPQHDAILREMKHEEAEEVRALERYPPDTAGGIMTTEVTALPEDLTVGQAIEELRRLNEELEQMFYVYVVDRRRHLVGVLSMRDLILARPERRLSKIMRTEIRSVPATMDQEEVARIMRRYGYLALPVVDDRNRLVGLITFDDAADVIEEEATEDVQKMAGAGPEERLTSPWTYSFRKRIGWLQVNLATAFLAAAVIGVFQETIAAVPILAAYQTIVSGMGGNASAQAMAVAIRGIALGEVDRKLLGKILYREVIVGLLSGITIGLTTAAIAFAFHHHDAAHPDAGLRQGLILGLVVFLALVINHINATVTGVAIPFIMKRLGFDPAQSATIFATTFTDCGGFFVTLWLAHLFMQWLR